jgi:hypothetical protein
MSAPGTSTSPVRPPATYSGRANRDGRIDLLRGSAVILLATEVVGHLIYPANDAFESTATVSGVAIVLLLEGALIGMRERPRVAAGSLGESTVRIWTQARNWYFTAMAMAVVVLLGRYIPGVNTAPIAAQSVDARGSPSLFTPVPLDASAVVIAYPLDPQVIVDTLFLRFGPWPFDLVAVAILPMLLAPLMLLLISRHKAALVLLVSSAIYFVELFTSARVLPTRAELSLPILGWQAVFVVGLIAGYYRRDLVTWFRTGIGLVVYLVVTVSTLAWLLLPVVLTFFVSEESPDLLRTLASPVAGWVFEPSAPGPLRVAIALNLVVAGYGLLTVLWKPISAAFGWLLEPIGSEVLTALITLVVAGIALSSVPDLPDNPVVDAAVTIAVVVIMWSAAKLRSVRRGVATHV